MRTDDPDATGGTAEGGRPGLDPRLFVNSVEKGATILELFETAGQELSLTDMVARTSMGRSAVQRFVYTLHRLDYLSRNPDTKRYSLGPKILRLYHGFIGGRSALERARHALVDLNQATRECVSWVELAGHEIIVVQNLPSPHITAIALAPGMRFEALSASSGQVLLAHARPEVVAQAFAASSPLARQRAGTDDLAALLRLLDRVRRQGYALTTKAFDQDSLSISAPVLLSGPASGGDGRHAVGAVNLSTLRGRFDEKAALSQLVPSVVAAASKASA